MDNLTKEQKFILCTLYKEYLKTKNNYFKDSDFLKDNFFQNYSYDDLSDICWKLHSKGYLICYEGDDKANDIQISDETIIYMENRFKNGLKEVLSFISNLI